MVMPGMPGMPGFVMDLRGLKAGNITINMGGTVSQEKRGGASAVATPKPTQVKSPSPPPAVMKPSPHTTTPASALEYVAGPPPRNPLILPPKNQSAPQNIMAGYLGHIEDLEALHQKSVPFSLAEGGGLLLHEMANYIWGTSDLLPFRALLRGGKPRNRPRWWEKRGA